jgi:hypothetical protein
MSDGISLALGAGPDDGYTAKSVCGCRIVFGLVPVSDLGMLAHGFSKKALMATDIADRIGASVVIGEPADLDALRKLDLPVSERRQRDGVAARDKGLPAVEAWLQHGERGRSSNAMCRRLFGVPQEAGDDHPLDPGDLRRCLAFLDATGAHEGVALMADVSPQWRRLVERWDEIVAALREEMQAGTSAPRT